MDAERIIETLDEIEWLYGDKDPDACDILLSRIEAVARRQGMIHYSDLVEGVTFRISTLKQGEPYMIDTTEWAGIDRRLLGDFLGYLSAASFRANGFMISALVIGKSESMPSAHFFEWMEQLGVLPDQKEDTVLAFWAGQVRDAVAYYGNH